MSRSKSSDPARTPMRRCIGCMQSRPKGELIRIAYYEGELTVDTSGRAMGRGVYLCPGRDCMEKAIKKKALNRGFRTGFDQDKVQKVFEDLEETIREKDGE